MKFYLAGSYPNRMALRVLNHQIASFGFEPMSRWLFLEHSITNPEDAPILGALYARHDHDDVRGSDVLILVANEPTDPYTSGGRHFEMGLAVAWLKPVIVFDPWTRPLEKRENIFHWYDRRVYVGNVLYPAVSIVKTEETLIQKLRELDAYLREAQMWTDDEKSEPFVVKEVLYA